MENAGYDDQRSSLRYEINVRVHVAQLGEVQGALARDLSLGGLFIESPMPYPVGATIPLRIIHPGTGEHIEALCEVVHQIPGETGKSKGLGLRFVQKDAALEEKLGSIVFATTQSDHTPSDDIINIAPEEIQPAGASALGAIPGPVTNLQDLIKNDAAPASDAKTLLSEAIRAERAGKHVDALHLLEKVLATGPNNKEEIQLRLARLAMGPLEDTRLAKLYVGAVLDNTPDHAEAKALLASIAKRDKQLGKGGKAIHKKEAKAEDKGTKKVGRTRQLIGAVALCALLIGFGLSIWLYYFAPKGPQPLVISPASLASMVPAKHVQIIRGCLYVRILDDKWTSLDNKQKTLAIKRLATWAKEKHRLQKVVLANSQPVLVGMATNGKVRVMNRAMLNKAAKSAPSKAGK